LLTGIFPALVTPISQDDTINTHALRELIEFLLDQRADGFYICGNTGEGMLLTEEERQQVAEATIQQVRGRAPVIVHVGAPATAMAERLAAHAREAGAYAVASVPPFYFTVDDQGIEDHYRRIQLAAGLPLYLYNIPDVTRVSLSAGLVSRLLSEGRPLGLKYTSYDMLSFREILETCGPELNVFAGPDEMLLPFLLMGAHGGIGTTYNCMPHLFVELYEAWRNRDIERARELQFQIDRVILVLRDHGVVPAVKAVMGMLGIDCGAPRRPLRALTAEQSERLGQELRDVGCFDHHPHMPVQSPYVSRKQADGK
jgi:N-acetylneuraminate lyase